MRLLVDIVEHSDQQANVAVEGDVELLALFDVFVSLDGYTMSGEATSRCGGKTGLPPTSVPPSRTADSLLRPA